MNKLIATLLCGLLAAGAHAQTKDNDKRSATSAPIGQAVSGHNTTAAGVSGTGLKTDGTANTGSAHAETGQKAAGIDATGRVTSKSTAVIGVAPGKSDNVNAQATNTTAPHSSASDAPATGGRGKAGTKAEQEVIDANSTAVKEPAGSRLKTAESVQAGKEKRAQVKEKTERKMDARANGSTSGNR